MGVTLFKPEYFIKLGEGCLLYPIKEPSILDLKLKGEQMTEKEIANVLYNACLDMDYSDCSESFVEEIECLTSEITKIKELGLDSLRYVLETLAIKNMEYIDWIKNK